MAETLKKPIIGKNVIETLTLGMYEDSRFVYREYVQNAVDQIDKAVALGILNNRAEGDVEIAVSKKDKAIIIEDNATGIKAAEVSRVLGNIAASDKDRTKDKGFRGIGRLGGLAYCDSLVFETSYKGEDLKSTLTWDAKKLKEIINDTKLKVEAADLISQITDVHTDKADKDEHYFRVILKNVTNPELLDEENIRNYLKMVAPVPFPNGFIFKKHISGKLIEDGLDIDEYRVFINTNQLFKSYTSNIYEPAPGGKKSIDEIFDLQFFTINNSNGELLAWAWYGVSKFEKQIVGSVNPARGIRLRKGNIQIGNEYTLVKLFKEQRGNFYFIGEVHAFHPELVPNARRDYFTENDTSRELEKGLKVVFHEQLHKLYHDANKIKNANKRILKLEEIRKVFEAKSEKGFTSNDEKEGLKEEFEIVKKEAVKAEKELQKIGEIAKDADGALKKVFDKIVNTKGIKIEKIDLKEKANGKTKYRTDELSRLNKEQRKFLARIFMVIDRELAPDTAEYVKQKIEEELK